MIRARAIPVRLVRERSGYFRTNFGRVRVLVPELRSGLETGDFSGLRVDTIDKPRKSYGVSYVVESADPGNDPFQTESEA